MKTRAQQMHTHSKKATAAIVLLCFFVLLGTPLVVSASHTPFHDGGPTETYQPLTKLPFVGDTPTLQSFLDAVIKLLLAIAAILAVIMIAIGGTEYMLSAAVGSKEAAKKRVWGAVVGLILALLAWLILALINTGITGGGFSLVGKISDSAVNQKNVCYLAYFQNEAARAAGSVSVEFIQDYNFGKTCSDLCTQQNQSAKSPPNAGTLFCSTDRDKLKDTPEPNTLPPAKRTGCYVRAHASNQGFLTVTKDRLIQEYSNALECTEQCDLSLCESYQVTDTIGTTECVIGGTTYTYNTGFAGVTNWSCEEL